ncbi:sigma-54-dependent Fis family transcriptional regulator [uncultured Muribaculum sp.]|uniref:sigma-54 interaction domain-containing protein n=2 Tax=uncultured Muribaculum sp. TaxID=1918613 RepID=UPI0026DF2CF6|nr:sigma-54 dependent transcriptional regulator [uncultured Muribaculum sp.]
MGIINIEQQVKDAKSRFGIVGNAPALIEAIQRALRVAPIDLSVLVTGESGTGKEFFPQIIHSNGSRKHAKYIAVNCGAIPEGTIDSELFGHEKGAFTGAVASRKGYFEEADGGTIFLDEVAELPLTTQARLLRVLESGEFLKVGSSTVQRTNIRVVAATNVDMTKAVAEGRFREDLYYRLSTVLINVPPLRDRGNDILLLARRFALGFAERYHMPNINFTENASEAMLHYRWPGNVRQLKNIIEQIALFEAGQEISAQKIRSYLPDAASTFMPSTIDNDNSHSYSSERELLFNMIFRMRNEIDSLRHMVESYEQPAQSIEPEMSHSLVMYQPQVHSLFKPEVANTANDTHRTLEDTERETIRQSLERNEGRRKATARELNISERTLYRKIKEYGLE